MTLLIIFIIVVLIFAASGSKSKVSAKNIEKAVVKAQRDKLQQVDKFVNNLYKNKMNTSPSSSVDDSIIDITGQNYPLPQQPYNNPQYSNVNQGYNFVAQYWGLGTKYKAKLRLNDNEVKMLDALIDTDNKFNSIEFVAIELIRMFFDSIDHLKEEFAKTGTCMEEQTNLIAELELTQRYKLWKNSKSYMAQLPVFANSINQVIYKICENNLRCHFFIGRKTDLKYYIYSNDALAEFNTRFGKIIDLYIPIRVAEMKECDEVTESQLNEYNRSRWKNQLDILKDKCENYGHQIFYERVVTLGIRNKTNPAVENIFFDASKFMAKLNKEVALKLYVYYIYYDLHSATFDNKQLAKTIQKSLFSNDQQIKDFESIINTLIQGKKIEVAIDGVSKIYTIKRKKIQLDSTKIKEAQAKDSDTVELLNKYLKDEDESFVAVEEEVKEEEVSLAINYTNIKDAPSIYKESNLLSPIQEEALNLFSKKGFTVSVGEFDAFAKSKGAFKNSLIESINSIYFDTLDDILIEEDADEITVNETYYNKIINS